MGKEWAGLFFPRGKNGPAHSFPGEKTDWGEIPACYTGTQNICLIGKHLIIIIFFFWGGGEYIVLCPLLYNLNFQYFEIESLVPRTSNL